MAQPLAISQILPKPGSNGKLSSLLTLSKNLPEVKSQAALRVIERYGESFEFLKIFNPDKQVEYTKDLRRVYCGEAPKLGLVRTSYGAETIESWIELQLYNLSEFAGCKEKLNIQQVEETAKIIVEQYGFLNVVEFMLFCQKFKRCEYGRFYGAVDPMLILGAVSDFVAERNYQLQMYENEEKAKQEAVREAEREAIKNEYRRLVPDAFAENASITFPDFNWGGLYKLTDEEFNIIRPEVEKIKNKEMSRYGEISKMVDEIISQREQK